MSNVTSHHQPLEILGLISTQHASETHAPQGPFVDTTYVKALAQAHEYSGFDRVLIGYHSAYPDGFQVAAFAAQHTSRLKFLLAHRPGFIAPTVAARSLATLDQFSDGRLAVHIISGGSDEEQQKDGDFLTKAERYARTDDYLDVVTRTWTANAPFDHDGPYYRVKGAFSGVKPRQTPHIPVFFGGASDEAIAVAGKHADVYALFGEPVDEVRQIVSRVRGEAGRHGRADHIRFSVSLRPIIGRTEDEAWARAERILETARELQANQGSPFRFRGANQAVGSQRLLDTAKGGKVRDKRLWTEIAALTGAQGNSTSLVGTAEQVVDSLLDYYDAGVTKFLFRGFDPLEDAIDYGRGLIPLLRQRVAERSSISIAAE